jgi:hypothetical protein
MLKNTETGQDELGRDIYFVEYTDGTFAECLAEDESEALDIMAGDREMAHGPILGRAPADADVDRHFS